MSDEKWAETGEVDDAVQQGNKALGISASVDTDDDDNAGHGDKATYDGKEAAYNNNDGKGMTGTVVDGGQSTQQSAYRLS